MYDSYYCFLAPCFNSRNNTQKVSILERVKCYSMKKKIMSWVWYPGSNSLPAILCKVSLCLLHLRHLPDFKWQLTDLTSKYAFFSLVNIKRVHFMNNFVGDYVNIINSSLFNFRKGVRFSFITFSDFSEVVMKLTGDRYQLFLCFMFFPCVKKKIAGSFFVHCLICVCHLRI